MNVKPVLPKRPGKPEAYGTTIYLNEMEAGFLRAILYDFVHQNDAGGEAFANQLFRELDKYEYPDYNDKHPDWIKESNSRLKSKGKKGYCEYEDDED